MNGLSTNSSSNDGFSGSACRSWRGPLVEAVFGELAGQRLREFEAHLAGCDRCQAQLASFENTTAKVREIMPPRPLADQLDIWRRLGPQLDAIDASQQARHRGLRLGYPAAAALAAALLMLGLGLGLFVRAPIESPISPSVSHPTSSPEMEFARFLERSTPLLLAIANRQVGESVTVSYDTGAERRLAENLAKDAATLADALEDLEFRRQADLLRDLEVVFLQLANLPEEQYRHGIEMVQATLESRALIFQLSVEEMRRL